VPVLAVLVQISIGISLVRAGEASGAHRPLEMIHVAAAGGVWAVLVGLAALVGPPALWKERATKEQTDWLKPTVWG
jgi:hypothetical protein